ncbi:hypothetical protein [Embleya scabrispora]|uniref:hypothetical protein n=1 Tax=Embleya scabrispora TaxID=159449 RepID=UPI00036E9737|nr:hypothetical protein [Embleya scabrispora]MYS81085.1 hypothetical protein [Streptomyces sp. SID5474]
MGVLSTIGVICLPVLAAWSLLRMLLPIWRGGKPRIRDVAGAGLWLGGTLTVGSGEGYGWLLIVGWGLLAVFPLFGIGLGISAAASALNGKGASVVDPARLMLRIATAARPDTAQSILLGVARNGTVILGGMPADPDGLALPPRVRLAHECPFCFVEEILVELVQDTAPHIAEYRNDVAHGRNRVFILGRLDGDPRLRAEINTLAGEEKPHAVDCPVHGPA